IPIVFAGVGDPVGAGLAQSLARPGGNATGLSNLGHDLIPKLLELLREVLPNVTRLALLWNPTFPAEQLFKRRVSDAASAMKMTLVSVEMGSLDALDAALSRVLSERADALMLTFDVLQVMLAGRIAEWLTANHMPAVQTGRGRPVSVGSLLSYGRDL